MTSRAGWSRHYYIRAARGIRLKDATSTAMNDPLLTTDIPGLARYATGKVRDIYDLGHTLLIVTTDRISAYDAIMPNGIPDKGRVLTALSRFWFLHLRPFI